MGRLFLLLALSPLALFAQDPSKSPLGSLRFRVVLPEEAYETDNSKTVVHFVTNRLLVSPKKGEPKWAALAPDRLFLKATEEPLVGFTVVKHDGSPDKEDDANLAPYSIETFTPVYDVRVKFHEDRFPPITNEVAKNGLSFLESYWKRNVLIYVHGFNNDWQTAIKRAAQLKRDLKKKYKEDFAIVVYSWPSLGGGGILGIAEYLDDERRYEKSLPAFAKFLEAILLKGGDTRGRGKRWALAHSMGNRVFLHGFAEFGRQKEKAQQPIPRDLFNRIVLAAPDMEVSDFKTHTDYIHQFCSNPKPLMYFHATSNVAVNVSELEHLDTRAGVTGVKSDNLLTIDAKAAKSPLSELGHGYYASNDKMVELIAEYFFGDIDPTTSPELEQVDGTRFRLK